MMPSDQSDKEKDKMKNAFTNFASDLHKAEKEDEEAKKEILKEGIERLESEDGQSINQSKILTAELSKMREQADMSPFVGTSGKIKSPRFRRGEFIEILARELLYIGREELKDKGAIISLNKLRDYFAEKRDNWELRDNDIPEALEWLDKEDLIPNLSNLGKDTTLIHFRPVELTNDSRKVMEAATGIEATVPDLKSILGWTDERLQATLDILEQDGIIIQDGENIYFPGLY